MFQKPAFGSTTTNFGSFNSGTSTASPFGGFKPTTGTSAFGAPPAFGAATSTQPTTGGGLFGTTNTTGGLFGASTASTSTAGFGASTSGFGFGATQPATGGLFGNTSTVGGGLFGASHNQTAFGAKPTGFGFGGTTTTGATTGGSLFGSTPSTGTGLFGQQTTTLGGGGLFSSNTAGAFGQQQPQQTGTAQVKYNPVVGTDVVVKSGTSQSVNIKHHCITCMKEYENKSLEELRLEDYVAGRKGNTSGVFGGFQQQTENKPLFGNTSFGQPATTSAPSVFGGGSLGGAGFAQQPSSFSFANNAQSTNTTGLFGANKPAFGAAQPTGGTGLFGATTTQAPTFGTNTSTFGFGSTTQTQQPGGLLFGGAKPATTGFGAPAATSGFGAFGSSGVFGAKTQAPTFGTQAPAFGSMTSGAFGTTTSSAGGGLFGGQTFGKPTTAPTFGFNTQPSGLGTGLGGGLGTNQFQAKPAAPAFGQLGSTMFPQQTQNTFKTGLDSGLGGGMFGNNSSLGGLGMGMGGMLNNSTTGMNNSLSGSSAGGNVHEQILTLAARPYGDSPLFKDLLPDSSTTAEDVLKPTNPAAVKAVLDSSSTAAYRVSSPTALRLTVTPRTTRDDKKSLFDGLEESDASLEDKLCLKPSRKRLVLRPNQRTNDTHHDSVDHTNDTGRSLDEHRESNGLPSKEMPSDHPNIDEVDRRQDEYISLKNASTGRQADITSGTDRHGSWLSSSKLPWNEKEKSIDGDSTPRLYPNLDKDIQTQAAERRASWLTTKPLRAPLVNNPDSAENSVRELAVRSDRSHDKENIDTLSMSEEEHVSPREAPPHPTGVKLTRPGYYTIPSLDEMIAYIRPDGSCPVPHLTIGRKNYGNVYYDCEIDVAGMDLDSLVHFLNKEVIIYPEESAKPPLGSGLNRRAIVTLDRVWPKDKSEKRPITSPERLLKMEYESKLRRVCDKHNTKFIEYRPQTGSWVFRVEHFSKYGLTDSDEEEDVPQLMKRQLVSQTLQGSAAPAPKQPVTVPSVGLGGLGSSAGLVPEDNLFAMQQTSLNLLNGAAKAFEMDTTEDNNESQSLYLDNKAYGVKSPTSELARLENRQSHNVQLMKASLYADTEMEDDVSVSTGDQLVPAVSGPLLTVPSHPPSVLREDHQIAEVEVPPTEEIPMRPLIVRPHTIVLKYHRKVPPFKQTIAGRLNAAYISDMSVCRARHSRVGFGPAGALTFATSYDSVNELPRSAELSELGKYVHGRSQNDWSEPLLVRMALGQPGKNDRILEVLKKHLATLLEHSTFTQIDENQCARFSLSQNASERREVLSQYLRDAADNQARCKFGVSGAYCYEVWRLCDALWGADLENDGVPGTDPLSVVNRHRMFLEWLKTAVAEATDEDLSKPTPGEKEDEADGHSARIWTLMLGGRILEACKVAKEHGDLNMAILIAQAAGDPAFRSLITRQLTLWRECGADSLISSHRWATLQLLAAQSSPRDKLLETDWLRALHATARYFCPHVPSLEQVIRTYEGFFTTNHDGDDDVDLSLIENDEMNMKLPLPPYVTHYDVTVVRNDKQRRFLDLRYELVRARAFNTRPKLRPAAYTPDPLDYSLCFLLGTWFGNPSVDSITGIADQLEASGEWHLAVQALSYHPDDTARGHLIRGVLSRHAPARADTADLKARLELIRRLKVPEQWLLLAQAYRAKYEHLPSVEVEHLVGARQWNAAHKILLEELLPEAVLADDLQSIAPILEKMNEAAQRHEVSGWENGGQALHCYLHVCDEIRGLVSSAEAQQDRANVHARLEALRPKVAAACRALGGLQPKSGAARLARTEMGARLVQCTLAAQEPPAHLAALLRALKLPPDTTYAASHKISSLLASRAAESCGVSAASPVSARATAS